MEKIQFSCADDNNVFYQVQLLLKTQYRYTTQMDSQSKWNGIPKRYLEAHVYWAEMKSWPECPSMEELIRKYICCRLLSISVKSDGVFILCETN